MLDFHGFECRLSRWNGHGKHLKRPLRRRLLLASLWKGRKKLQVCEMSSGKECIDIGKPSDIVTPNWNYDFTSLEWLEVGVVWFAQIHIHVYLQYTVLCVKVFVSCRSAWLLAIIKLFCLLAVHLGVSQNNGTPKWMVYKGKPLLKWMIWGSKNTAIFGNNHIQK